MRRWLLLTFLLTVCLHVTHGQSVYSIQHDASWEMRYADARKTDYYTNMVLKQLGLAYLKIPEHTSFIFHYNYGASVSFQQGNLLDISVSLTPSFCSGDIKVRDFDLQKLLFPALCSFRLAVIHPYKGEVFSSVHENVRLFDLMLGYSPASFPDSLWMAGSRVEVEFKGFHFDEESFKRIENELFAIRDYDAAATLCDTLEKKIRAARVSLHTPQEAFGIYVFASKSNYLLSEAAQTHTEIVPGDDPRKLLGKVSVVNYQFQDLTKFLIDEGSGHELSGNVYLNMASAYGKALSDALKLSQKVDYYSSPFYYRLYSNSTTVSQMWSAMRWIRLFTQKRGLPTLNLALLSRRIMDEYLRLAENLMSEARYAEAVDMLTSAERFCAVNPTAERTEQLTATLMQARSGLTASYIRIVQKALDNNLPSLADKYLAEAMQLTAKYNNLSTSDSAGFAGLYGVLSGKNIQAGNRLLADRKFSEALAVYNKALITGNQFNLPDIIKQAEKGQLLAVNGIYRHKYRKSEEALRQGNTDEAASKLKEAIDFASGYPDYQADPVAADSLEKSIALFSYTSLVTQAADFSLVHNHMRAVEFLLKANELSIEHHLSHSALFDSIANFSGVFSIQSLLSDGRLKLWAGEPENALMLAAQAKQLETALGLSAREELRQQYNALMEFADESLCNRVKGELSSLIRRADENFAQNKFEVAEHLVLEARELIYSKASCGLNTVELNKLTSKYQFPLRWNAMVKEAGRFIDNGDYLQGIELIQQSGALYNYYRLDTLGLMNTGLYEMAMKSSHLPLITYAAGYYVARNKFDEAFQLLGQLFKTGINADETNDLQESIARGLAQRDLAATDALNLKNMLRFYTNGDKWYRRFTEVYKYHVENK